MSYREQSLISKKNILDRLRHAPKLNTPSSSTHEEDGFLFPIENPKEEFIIRFTKTNAELFEVNSLDEISSVIKQLTEKYNWQNAYCIEQQFTDSMSAISELEISDSLEHSDVSITPCDALIARTGSVVFTSSSTGRQGTIYSPYHIIIAFTSQLLVEIKDYMETINTSHLPSMINFNTGASRTADIEKTLVVGIHGPKEIFMILIDDLKK